MRGWPVSTKLRAPVIVSDHLPRPALVDLICGRSAPPLVLIRAPAGFGKTMLMAECRERLGATQPVGWISLDGADNDAFRFTRDLEAALAELGLPQEPPSPPRAEGWLSILDRVAACPAPFVLFLDDFEAISDDAVLGLTRELVRALPPGARMVIGSRTPPEIGLGRLRAKGMLLELQPDDMRFTDRETAAFLTVARGLRLSEADLARLHAKTEGWPAALRLASIALERDTDGRDFIERFSGSHDAVTEYLAEDILAGLPPERVAFLLRTAILQRLEPELCDALHPLGGSAGTLAALARGNVLITPIGGQGSAYRYHSLFGSFLRDQLARRMASEIPGLHAAASRWYVAAGRPVPAIEHAIAGGDWAAATDLLDGHGRDFLEQGRLRLLTRWFDALPAQATAHSPELRLVQGWALCFARGPLAAAALLDDAVLEDAPDAAVAAEARAIRTMVLTLTEDYAAAHDLARAALSGPRLRSSHAAAALSNCLASVLTCVGALDEARASLTLARKELAGAGDGFNAMFADGTEGIMDLMEGRIRDAGARFRLALAASRHDPRGRNGRNAWAVLLHASAVYEGNELRTARHLIQLHLPIVRDLGLIDHTILGYVMLSRIAFEDGDPDTGFGLLKELDHVALRRQMPRAAASARLETARALAWRGHPDAAQEQFDRANDPAVWQPAAQLRLRANDLDYPEVTRFRLALHAGRAGSVLGALRREIGSAVAAGRLRRALMLRLLEGAALYQSGDPETSHAVLQGALADAAREGAVRMILDEQQPLGVAIRAAVARGLPIPGRRDPHFRVWLEDLLAAMPGHGCAGRDADSLPPAPLDRLTTKELEVLRLLSEGHSNAALAERLAISGSTVRTHLRSINSKLNAGNRTQAVAYARRLGMIP